MQLFNLLCSFDLFVQPMLAQAAQNITQTLHGTAIYAYIGVVPGGSMGWQSVMAVPCVMSGSYTGACYGRFFQSRCDRFVIPCPSWRADWPSCTSNGSWVVMTSTPVSANRVVLDTPPRKEDLEHVISFQKQPFPVADR